MLSVGDPKPFMENDPRAGYSRSWCRSPDGRGQAAMEVGAKNRCGTRRRSGGGKGVDAPTLQFGARGGRNRCSTPVLAAGGIDKRPRNAAALMLGAAGGRRRNPLEAL